MVAELQLWGVAGASEQSGETQLAEDRRREKEPRRWELKTMSPPIRSAYLSATPRVSDRCLRFGVPGVVTGFSVWFGFSAFMQGGLG